MRVDVAAVGESGTIQQYGGSTWPHQISGTTLHLYGAWAGKGFSFGHYYIVGENGTILRYSEVPIFTIPIPEDCGLCGVGAGSMLPLMIAGLCTKRMRRIARRGRRCRTRRH